MKDKAPVIVLIIVAIGLGVALIVVNNKARDQAQQADDRIKTLSNTVVTVRTSLEEQQAVNRVLETNLFVTTTQYSNKLASSEAQLAGTAADLAKAQAEAKAQADAAAAELAQRDKKIADLENQNQELDKQAVDLHGSISNLASQIAVTQNKLATSEGDRDLLLKELKRLQLAKADLESKFNDLVAVREQLHKLREELAVARRLDWIRRGIYETFNEKGGERLVHPFHPVPTNTNTSLNVILRQDGGVKIQAPPPTNN
jgi:chromosome segregation ATPase